MPALSAARRQAVVLHPIHRAFHEPVENCSAVRWQKRSDVFKNSGNVKMGQCANHPNRETDYICLKHHVYMCAECLHCRDPEIYCKFRSSCPIWFMQKRSAGLDDA
jgi:hypothetical protein